MSKFGKREVAQIENVNRLSCHATGCPLRGSVDVGGSGRFACSFHAFSESHQWPAITEKLIENGWFIDYMQQVKRMEQWRELAQRFWEEDKSMWPTEYETKQLYLYRLHKELGYRVGDSQIRPKAIKRKTSQIKSNLAPVLAGLVRNK